MARPPATTTPVTENAWLGGEIFAGRGPGTKEVKTGAWLCELSTRVLCMAWLGTWSEFSYFYIVTCRVGTHRSFKILMYSSTIEHAPFVSHICHCRAGPSLYHCRWDMSMKDSTTVSAKWRCWKRLLDSARAPPAGTFLKHNSFAPDSIWEQFQFGRFGTDMF